MKKITAFVISLIVVFSFSSCRNNKEEYVTTPSGFMLTPGVPCTIEGWLTYKVIEYDGDYLNLVDKAEKMVKSWWNDDTTFSKPEIVWIEVMRENIRGFQDSGYLFLDPNTNDENDLLATTVHEWLHHLVDKYTLIGADGMKARKIMEMVVEAITVDILESHGIKVEIPTENYKYFISHKELYEKKDELIKAFRNQEGFSAYERIFGKDYMKIIEKVEKELVL